MQQEAAKSPLEKQFTGHFGSLSPAQTQALDEFKKDLISTNNFIESRHDDFLLLRFLRARQFNIAKAKKMLVECEKWRVDFKVDELVKSFVFEENAVVNTIYPRYYHKTDLMGRPIYIEHLGKLNTKHLMQITTQERILQNYVCEYEKAANIRFPACSKACGSRIETSTTILDLKGVPLMQFSHVLGFVKSVSAISQNYYPETLGRMFIINAPMLFSTVWSVVKGFLDEVTAKKISVLGSDYYKVLIQHIDPANLPECFGGTCSCKETCALSDAGPWIEYIKELDAEKQKTQGTTENQVAENNAVQPAAVSN